MGATSAVVRAAATAAVFALAGAQHASAAVGDFDTSFGQGGKTILPINANNARANAVALQPDGKIVVVGTAFQDGVDDDAAFVATRLNADGGLDTGFGDGGTKIINIDLQVNGDDRAESVTVGPSGEIVIGGSARAGAKSVHSIDIPAVSS